jgi:rare lipoprotein A
MVPASIEREIAPPAPVVEPKPNWLLGKASFYHDSLAGNLTANGEIYDPRALTCAHKTLPFGTTLEIVAVTTGRSARCRINDRGPFIKGRFLDVSRRVATLLDMIDMGVIKVRVRIL